MAIAAVTKLNIPDQAGTAGRTVQFTWASMAGGDTGTPVSFPTANKLTIQATGTVTTLIIEGSNDGTNWATLNDLSNTAIASLGAAIEGIQENPRFIRPNLTTGTAVVVTLVASE